MKNFFTLLLFISFFNILLAQKKQAVSYYLSGKITDAKTGLALGRASIYIHEAHSGIVSNDSGFFKTVALAPGKYLVEISYLGYETIVENIDINANTVKNFAMNVAVVEQEGVTITGVSSATRIKLSPQPIAIMKRSDLIKLNSTNIINSLTNIPGVNAVTTGLAISKPFIRGLGYNRVVTVNDGVRQEGQQWGDEHGIEIDDYSAQRIEVLKGPGSLMYGSDALAGVINIQSLSPATEGFFKVNALSEYQTNNQLRGFYGNFAGTKNGFSFNVYGSYKGAADYKNKYDGYVFNSKFYDQNFGGMIGYAGSWGRSYLTITNFDQHLGIVEGNRDSASGQFIKVLPGGDDTIATNGDFKKINPEIPYQRIRHFKIVSDNSFNVGKNKLDITMGFQRNQRQEFGNPDEPETPNAYFDLKTFNYATKFNLAYSGNWKTSFGVSGMFQNNRDKAAEALIPNYNLFDIGGFVFTQYHKDKLTLSGGLRFDNRNIISKEMFIDNALKFAAFKKDFSNISGSAGLSYQASKQLTLKFNMARGFRAPSLAELASNGAHEGTNRYEVGNIDLKSETSFQIDGGIEFNSQHITLSAGIYYNTISDFIFYEKMLNAAGSDSILTDNNSGKELHVFRFTSNNANLYGFEFNMDIHPHPLDWLHFENTFSYTRAQFTSAIDGNKNVPLIPAARYLAELKGNLFSKGKTIRNLYISVESDYTFKQDHAFTGYNTETTTSDYWLINASIGTDIIAKGKTICSIHLTAMNLGDIAYQNHLSRLKYTDVNNVTGRQGVFNAGRNFGIKLNVPLDFEWK